MGALTHLNARFAPVNLDRRADGPDFGTVVDELTEDDPGRAAFLKACLTKLGLSVDQGETPVPSLSRLHLSSLDSSAMSALLARLQNVIVSDLGEEWLEGENDMFQFLRAPNFSMGSMDHSLQREESKRTDDHSMSSDIGLDYKDVVKHVLVHEEEHPTGKDTPYFNHHAFFSNLKHYQSSIDIPGDFGRCLLYGEVVTSTSTMLEK